MNRLFFSLLLSGLASLLLLVSTGASAQTGESSQFIYVCNQGSASVTVIDASTQTVSETVDLQEFGFSENAKPHHVVAESDGSYWYVTLIGENSVLKFNRNNELVDQAELEVPGLLAMHPQDDLLFVGRSMSAVNPPQSFGVVNRSNMEVLDEIDLFFTRPHALTTSVDGSWTFVGSLSENQLLSYNLENDESNLTNVSGNTHVYVNFAVHPDGTTMVATGQVSGQLLVFDISDPMNPMMTDMIKTEAMPWHPVFSPDGKYVYFGNKQDHSVSVVNMENRTVDTVIKGEGLAQPHGAALSRDGKYLFISNNNLDGTYTPEVSSPENPVGTVTIIDTETREIVKIIEVGNYPSGIGTNAW
jgi:YVTN family beta-propeller protein